MATSVLLWGLELLTPGGHLHNIFYTLLKGANGVCSLYSLSGEWKTKLPPPKKTNKHLSKARAIKLKLKQES
jgi:hypothetical protein